MYSPAGMEHFPREQANIDKINPIIQLLNVLCNLELNPKSRVWVDAHLAQAWDAII